jgi:hypothetical protein
LTFSTSPSKTTIQIAIDSNLPAHLSQRVTLLSSSLSAAQEISRATSGISAQRKDGD